MTGIQGSVDEIDVKGHPEPYGTDPLASLLAGRQSRRDQSPPAGLENLVRRDVIPMIFQRFASLSRQSTACGICLPAEVYDHLIAGFTDLLLAGDQTGAIAFVEALHDQDQAIEWTFINILKPAAGRLHDLWQEDSIGFAEASLAIHDLSGVLRHFAPAFRAAAAFPGHDHYRALFMPAPGAKSSAGAELFGLALASEFLRRDGWEASIEGGLAGRAMGDAVRREWFDTVIIGRCERQHLDAVAAGIHSMRRFTRNRRLGIILHGRIFVENSGLQRQLDADYVSYDPETSLIQAKHFVTLPSRRAYIQ